MVVFTLLSLIGFAIAVLLKEGTNQLYISSGVMFSAGVLLAGGLVHLLGDSTEGFDRLAVDGRLRCSEKCFPWSFAISGLTVVALVCIEIIVRDMTIQKLESGNNTRSSNSNNNNNNNNNNNHSNSRQQFDANRNLESTISPRVDNANEDKNATEVVVDAAAVESSDNEAQRKSDAAELTCQDINILIGNHGDNSVETLTAVVLTTALSIHVIIEGIGIGAMDDISAIQASFVGVAFHKSFTAYALANSLVSCGYWKDKAQRKYFYASTGLFIGLTLVGIAVGWGVSTAIGNTEDSLGSAIVVAVTAGSFFYVSAFEIIPEEMSIIKRNRLQTPWIVFWFLLGYCLMTLLAIWA
eukprot:jgi/Psemu1/304843/fgenesh1_kg.171_\